MPFDGDIRRWQDGEQPGPYPLAVLAALTALSWGIVCLIATICMLSFFDAAGALRVFEAACALFAIAAFLARGRVREIFRDLRQVAMRP